MLAQSGARITFCLKWPKSLKFCMAYILVVDVTILSQRVT